MEALPNVLNVLLLFLQVRAISVGLKNIVLPSDEAQVKAQSSGNKEKGADRSGVVWKKGEIEFEALMRTMDRLVNIHF